MPNGVPLKPLDDTVISWLFSSTDDGMDLAACELINAILGNAGQSGITQVIELRSQYGIPGFEPNGRAVRLDIYAKSIEGKIVNIEVTLGDNRDHNDRSIFNASKLMVQEAARGSATHLPKGYENEPDREEYLLRAHYMHSPQIIAINILNRVLRQDSDAFHHPMGMCYLQDGVLASDKMLIHNIELPRFAQILREREPNLDDPLELWLYSLTQAYTDTSMIMERMQMNPGLHAFMQKFDRAATDPDLLRWREKVYEGEMDLLARLASAREEAFEEGEAKGRAVGEAIGKTEGKLEVARILLMHHDLETVASYTGITVAELQAIKLPSS